MAKLTDNTANKEWRELVERTLSHLGIDVSADDLSILTASFVDQTELMRSLDKLDTWDVEPAFVFDPTWND